MTPATTPVWRSTTSAFPAPPFPSQLRWAFSPRPDCCSPVAAGPDFSDTASIAHLRATLLRRPLSFSIARKRLSESPHAAYPSPPHGGSFMKVLVADKLAEEGL